MVSLCVKDSVCEIEVSCSDPDSLPALTKNTVRPTAAAMNPAITKPTIGCGSLL